MNPQTFVIVGASLAGASASAQLRKDGFAGRVLLIGDEPDRPYERPLLSKAYVRGTADRPELDVHNPTFYVENDIELRTSIRVTAIEPRTSEVVLEDGHRLRYDRLLLATGSAPRRLDIPGAGLAGVHYLRGVGDAEAIRVAAASAGRAVVIGGGWIGAEIAASLRQLGLPVALVAPGSVPLERVLGTEVGGIYRDLHGEHGVELFMGRRIVAMRGTNAVAAVETADGMRIAGDLVVVGVGATPRTALAVDAGLAVDDGIVVDEFLESSVPGIFAAGDVAAAWHPLLETRIRVEHWDNAKRQGRAAARNMMGRREPYMRVPYFYSDQYDLDMEYAGYAPVSDQVVFRGEPAHGTFMAFWLSDGRVAAGMNANVRDVNGAITTLVSSRRRVRVDRLADPAVPLDDLEALVAADAVVA